MSRQSIPNRTTRPAATPAPAPAPTSSAVRNTSIPKSQPAGAQQQITHEMIAKRAYEISRSPQRGSDYDNWVRAERELRSGR
jgi:hypothetical protein